MHFSLYESVALSLDGVCDNALQITVKIADFGGVIATVDSCKLTISLDS